MPRNLTITSTAAPASGHTLSGTAHQLLAADGITPLSNSAPPYNNVSDGLLYYKQTVTQDDNQTDTITIPIAGRVTDLAATSVAAPVLTWSDVGGETTYEVYRGTSSNFVPDAAGGSNRIATGLAAGTVSYTDSAAAVSTQYYYQVLTRNTYGVTSVSNVAGALTPAGTVSATFRDDFTGTDGAILTTRANTWQGGAGLGSWTKDAGADFKLASNRVYGNTSAGQYHSTATVAANGTARLIAYRAGTSYLGSMSIRGRWDPVANTFLQAAYTPTGTAWQLRKRVTGTFGTVAGSPADVSDTWPAGEYRTLEFEMTATGLVMRIYANDGVTLIGTISSTDTSVSAAGYLGLALDGTATSGPHADSIEFTPA